MEVLARGLGVPKDTLRQIADGQPVGNLASEELLIQVSSTLREKIAEDAMRCHRSINAHIVSILEAYYGSDVNLNQQKLLLARKTV